MPTAGPRTARSTPWSDGASANWPSGCAASRRPDGPGTPRTTRKTSSHAPRAALGCMAQPRLSREGGWMDLGLRGQTALVAAASRGLGKAVAKLFVEEGVRVAICARRKEALEAAAADIGGDVLPVQADVSNAEDADRFVSTAAKRFGGIDILVNNAGGPPAGPFLESSDEQCGDGSRPY